MTFAEMKDRIRTAIYSEWKHNSGFTDRYRAERTLNFAADIFDTRKEPARLKEIVAFLECKERDYTFSEYDEIPTAYNNSKGKYPFSGLILNYNGAGYSRMIKAMYDYLRKYSQIYSEYKQLQHIIDKHFDTLGEPTHDFTSDLRLLHENRIISGLPCYKSIFNLMLYAYIKGIRAERARHKKAVM